MGFFYFDESVQDLGAFVIGAFVYSKNDLTPTVFAALEAVGMRPQLDEFKSSARMAANPTLQRLRNQFEGMLASVRIGFTVTPRMRREDLGGDALTGLIKILSANDLQERAYAVYLDEGISPSADAVTHFQNGIGQGCQLHLHQDSKIVGGIQLADLVAHSLGIMLLSRMGFSQKRVAVGDNSGYSPHTEMSLDFLKWASLRYSFFRAPMPEGIREENLVGTRMFNVEDYAIYVSPHCSEAIRSAVSGGMGRCYLGCIH